VFVFTIEYLARFWSCVEDPEISSRLSYLVSFYSLVDLASIVPFFVDIALVTMECTANPNPTRTVAHC